MRSGLSICLVVEFQVWNSITFICAALTSASAVGTSSIGGWPGQYAGSSSRRPAMLSLSSCFWKNSSPVMPVGPRTSAIGRPLRCGSIHSATLS
jgi:hypothetical protein